MAIDKPMSPDDLKPEDEVVTEEETKEKTPEELALEEEQKKLELEKNRSDCQKFLDDRQDLANIRAEYNMRGWKGWWSKWRRNSTARVVTGISAALVAAAAPGVGVASQIVRTGIGAIGGATAGETFVMNKTELPILEKMKDESNIASMTEDELILSIVGLSRVATDKGLKLDEALVKIDDEKIAEAQEKIDKNWFSRNLEKAREAFAKMPTWLKVVLPVTAMGLGIAAPVIGSAAALGLGLIGTRRENSREAYEHTGKIKKLQDELMRRVEQGKIDPSDVASAFSAARVKYAEGVKKGAIGGLIVATTLSNLLYGVRLSTESVHSTDPTAHVGPATEPSQSIDQTKLPDAPPNPLDYKNPLFPDNDLFPKSDPIDFSKTPDLNADVPTPKDEVFGPFDTNPNAGVPGPKGVDFDPFNTNQSVAASEPKGEVFGPFNTHPSTETDLSDKVVPGHVADSDKAPVVENHTAPHSDTEAKPAHHAATNDEPKHEPSHGSKHEDVKPIHKEHEHAAPKVEHKPDIKTPAPTENNIDIKSKPLDIEKTNVTIDHPNGINPSDPDSTEYRGKPEPIPGDNIQYDNSGNPIDGTQNNFETPLDKTVIVDQGSNTIPAPETDTPGVHELTIDEAKTEGPVVGPEKDSDVTIDTTVKVDVETTTGMPSDAVDLPKSDVVVEKTNDEYSNMINESPDTGEKNGVTGSLNETTAKNEGLAFDDQSGNDQNAEQPVVTTEQTTIDTPAVEKGFTGEMHASDGRPTHEYVEYVKNDLFAGDSKDAQRIGEKISEMWEKEGTDRIKQLRDNLDSQRFLNSAAHDQKWNWIFPEKSTMPTESPANVGDTKDGWMVHQHSYLLFKGDKHWEPDQLVKDPSYRAHIKNLLDKLIDRNDKMYQ